MTLYRVWEDNTTTAIRSHMTLNDAIIFVRSNEHCSVERQQDIYHLLNGKIEKGYLIQTVAGHSYVLL